VIFRSARHTNQLDAVTNFYCKVLGLKVLGQFENHNGYDGVFLGKDNSDWHLEFTSNPDLVQHTFDEDDILVFYPQSTLEYESILNKIRLAKVKTLDTKNPYWKTNGTMIKDPDGYNIIISPLKS